MTRDGPRVREGLAQDAHDLASHPHAPHAPAERGRPFSGRGASMNCVPTRSMGTRSTYGCQAPIGNCHGCTYGCQAPISSPRSREAALAISRRGGPPCPPAPRMPRPRDTIPSAHRAAPWRKWTKWTSWTPIFGSRVHQVHAVHFVHSSARFGAGDRGEPTAPGGLRRRLPSSAASRLLARMPSHLEVPCVRLAVAGGRHRAHSTQARAARPPQAAGGSRLLRGEPTTRPRHRPSPARVSHQVWA